MGTRLKIIACLLVVAALAAVVHAQLGERPGNSLDNPIDTPRDLSGLSIKNPRTRIVHTTDPALEGGSMYLQQVDPWLGYKWGWSLTQREFRDRDGVYGDAGKLDGIILPDGSSKMMSRSHANSCAICHNTPFRDGGAGATIPKNGGEGRNTPHMYGAGLVEMIGQHIRRQALAIADDNRDGWISFDEAKGKRCAIHALGPEPRGTHGSYESHETYKGVIDYGPFADRNDDGKPDLNPLFNPIYVDKEGKRIATTRSLKSPGVAGYTIEVQVFGFGHLYMPFRPPVSTTLRSFIATPFDIHSGLQACDPTTLDDPDGDGFAQLSNAGCLQCVTAAGKDRGAVKNRTGLSMDDPDRDGYCEEISEGELDLAEWYLLNHPAPGRSRITTDVKRGEELFGKIGCAACHVPDWHLPAANPFAGDYTQRYAGDRRLFEMQVNYQDERDRLEGKLILLADRKKLPHAQGRVFEPLGSKPQESRRFEDSPPGVTRVLEQWIPRRRGYTVRGIYSDFKYHDVGEAFYQMQFDGSVIRQWRTPPLWGVGSTAPYGHDGASLTLDEVIRRHGGAAGESRSSYTALKSKDRRAVVAFLESLVLYPTERVPCDVDGDGKVHDHFLVAGVDTGVERFNPEWLFRVPGKIEGRVENVFGEKILSNALTNVRAAYGLDLPQLRDSDGDGFPDVIDPAPRKRGYRDGEN